MARGSLVYYVSASILTPFIVYYILTLSGLENTIGLAFSLLIFFVTFPIAIGVWVYQDARDRGWSGIFWALVSVFGWFPFGFAVYLFARSERRFRSKALVWYYLYGVVLPVSIIAFVLATNIGGILIVMAALVWMGFALTMLNPQPTA